MGATRPEKNAQPGRGAAAQAPRPVTGQDSACRHTVTTLTSSMHRGFVSSTTAVHRISMTMRSCCRACRATLSYSCMNSPVLSHVICLLSVTHTKAVVLARMSYDSSSASQRWWHAHRSHIHLQRLLPPHCTSQHTSISIEQRRRRRRRRHHHHDQQQSPARSQPSNTSESSHDARCQRGDAAAPVRSKSYAPPWHTHVRLERFGKTTSLELRKARVVVWLAVR